MSKRIKIAGLDLGSDIQIAIFAGIAIGGYYLYRTLTTSGSPITTGGAAQTNATTVASDLQAAQSAGNSLSYQTTQYQQWADEIFNAGSAWGPLLSDSNAVLGILDQINNDADWLALVQAFGTRGIYSGYFSFTQTPVTLGAFLEAAFSTSAIASFNQQLGWNGVTYTI